MYMWLLWLPSPIVKCISSFFNLPTVNKPSIASSSKEACLSPRDKLLREIADLSITLDSGLDNSLTIL